MLKAKCPDLGDLARLITFVSDLGDLARLITFVPDRPGHDWRYALDIHKIEQALNWRPQVNLTAGLSLTLDWYLANEDWLNRVRTGEYRQYLEQQYGLVVM